MYSDMLKDFFLFPPVHLDSTDVCAAKNYVSFQLEAKHTPGARDFRFIMKPNNCTRTRSGARSVHGRGKIAALSGQCDRHVVWRKLFNFLKKPAEMWAR